MLYFDWASTALPDRALWEESLQEALHYSGNPSAAHDAGKEARAFLEDLRARAAKALHADSPQQIYFNSGATEGCQFVFLSLLASPSRGRIIVNSAEHAAVYENALALKAFGFEVRQLNPNQNGHIEPEKLAKALTPDTKLAAVMLVNNETGAINPIAKLSQNLSEYESQTGKKVWLHMDGAQALGKTGVDLQRLACDSAVFSAHKIGGPRGSGLLYLKNPRPALLRGGGQESGIRSGTENIFGAAALVKALEKVCGAARPRETEKFLLQEIVKLGGLLVPQSRQTRQELFCPYIISAAFPPLPGEVLVRALNNLDVAVSAGSACSAHKNIKTRALTSMGVPPKLAEQTVRFSFSSQTDLNQARQLISRLKQALKHRLV